MPCLNEQARQVRMWLERLGTLEFMPPELLQKDEHGHYIHTHSTSGDLWVLFLFEF